MRRITPEEVLKAYEKTGLKPMQGEYFSGECACGLGAIVRFWNPEKRANDDNVADMLEKNGIRDLYRIGFYLGFDGKKHVNPYSHTAFLDGKSAWQAVKHLAVSP